MAPLKLNLLSRKIFPMEKSYFSTVVFTFNLPVVRGRYTKILQYIYIELLQVLAICCLMTHFGYIVFRIIMPLPPSPLFMAIHSWSGVLHFWWYRMLISS